MRLLNDKRGQVRIIEAFFAAVLLLSAVALIPKSTNNQNDTTQTLTSTAQNLLLSLDQDGQIGNLIRSQNWNELKMLIQTGLPPAAWFNLTVYDTNMHIINNIPISSGGPVSGQLSSHRLPLCQRKRGIWGVSC